MGIAHLPIELRTDEKLYLRDTKGNLLEYEPWVKKNKDKK